MIGISGDRGERNNNPGNIRHAAGVIWHGQSAQQTDSAFVQFDDPIYGIRAIARIITAYEREGIHTLAEAIDRWAPPNENNSLAYVQAVAEECNILPYVNVGLTALLPCIIKGIITHENGRNIYSAEQITQGIALAGIPA